MSLLLIVTADESGIPLPEGIDVQNFAPTFDELLARHPH
jgi:hypothetical protein